MRRIDIMFGLESDSTTVVRAFSPPFCVPWEIRNIWLNCINLVSNWNFVVSHIFREENSCVDALANLGLTLTNTSLFSSIPLCIEADFVKNMLALPFFRFA